MVGGASKDKQIREQVEPRLCGFYNLWVLAYRRNYIRSLLTGFVFVLLSK